MSEVGIIVVLFGAGLLILVAEIFIPSHGVLSVLGVGLLIAGVAKTFSTAGMEAGLASLVVCLVLLPVIAFFAVKVWPHTPVGKRVAPPNPRLTAADAGVPIEELAALVGKQGRCLTPLRPVGVCEFGRRRISCIVEFGLVDAGATVQVVGLSGGNLVVVGVSEKA